MSKYNSFNQIREDNKELLDSWNMEQLTKRGSCILEDTEEWQTILQEAFYSIMDNRNGKEEEKGRIKASKARWSSKHRHPLRSAEMDLIKASHDSHFNKDKLYILGVDISYIVDDSTEACIALVVLQFPDLKLFHKEVQMISIEQPYIPGYLAFRECQYYEKLIGRFMENYLKTADMVVLVDGNGILHDKKFGLACQLGLSLDVPCFGVAKKLYNINQDIPNDYEYKKELTSKWDTHYLKSEEGNILGAAIISSEDSLNPIYISQGHKISLETALCLVKLTSIFRVPEPIRLADVESRAYLRERNLLI